MELKNYFAQNAAGDVLPDAQAYLYQPGTTELATGLADAAGNPLGNPVAADANGLLQFRAPNGEYDLRVTAPGREYTVRIQCTDVSEGVAEAEAAAALAVSARTSAEALAELSGATVCATHADAVAALSTLADGAVVRVVEDETQGGRSSWYRVLLGEGASLELDFVAGEYGQGGLVFMHSQLKLVAVPATSTSPGAAGSLAIDAGYLYVAVGTNTWKRAALSAF